MLAIIVCTFTFLIIEFICYMLILALVEILVGLCLGYKFVSFSFAGLMIKNDNNKISFEIVPIRFLAMTILIRKEVNGKTKLIKGTSEFLIMTVLTILSLYIWHVISLDNIYLRYIDKTLILCLVFHGILFMDTVKKFFSKGHEHYIWEQEIKISNQLKNGIRPNQINLIDVNMDSNDFTEKKCILYNYFILLDNKKYDELLPYIEKFEQYIGTRNNIIASDFPYAFEIIYYYSMVNNDIKKAEHYVTLLGDVLKNDMDLNGRRVYAGYLIGTGKPKELIMKVFEQCKSYNLNDSSKIIATMEYDLISQLKENYL